MCKSIFRQKIRDWKVPEDKVDILVKRQSRSDKIKTLISREWTWYVNMIGNRESVGVYSNVSAGRRGSASDLVLLCYGGQECSNVPVRPAGPPGAAARTLITTCSLN